MTARLFTQGTLGEVDFIEAEAGGDRRKKILDIGCGTGRHAVELAKRGYEVTGLDLSETQLRKARTKAAEAGVKVEFIRADARNFRLGRKFDLAIMICEGAFPLMETDEMNFQILKNITRALKPDGKLIFTTLSALFPLLPFSQGLSQRGRSKERRKHLRLDDVPGSFQAGKRRRRRPPENTGLR